MRHHYSLRGARVFRYQRSQPVTLKPSGPPQIARACLDFVVSCPRAVSPRRSTMQTLQNAPQPHPNGANGGSSLDLRILLHGLQSMRDGDFSVRLPGDWTGLEGKIADTFNEIVATNQKMAQELKRVGHVVGKEGRTRERTKFHRSEGAWEEMEVSVNTLIDDLLRP